MMKHIALFLIVLSPNCLIAENQAQSDNERINLAKFLGIESSEIRYLEKGIFNSVFKRQRRSFEGFSGYIAATDTELYLMVNRIDKLREIDICALPINAIDGVSFDEQQLQIKFSLQVVVIRLEENENFAGYLLAQGVPLWDSAKTYTMENKKNPLFGVSYERPPIFALKSSKQRERHFNRNNNMPQYRIIANEWDPARVNHTPSN